MKRDKNINTHNDDKAYKNNRVWRTVLGSLGLWLSLLGSLVLAGCSSLPSYESPEPPHRRVPVSRPVPVDRDPGWGVEVLRSPEDDESNDELEAWEGGPWSDESVSYGAGSDGTVPGDVLLEEWQDEWEPVEEISNDVALGSAETRLLADARRYVSEGQLQQASSSVERVLRINPHSALALYELAKVRLAQSAPKEAEQLVLKAIASSRNDARSRERSFQRKLWKLVLNARRQLKDGPGILEAQARLSGL